MKIKKINTQKLLEAFTKLGISYHSFGTLQKRSDKGRTINTHDFYKTDRLTNRQKHMLSYLFPSLEFYTSKCEYAPEIQGAVIASPKAQRIKELNANL